MVAFAALIWETCSERQDRSWRISGQFCVSEMIEIWGWYVFPFSVICGTCLRCRRASHRNKILLYILRQSYCEPASHCLNFYVFVASWTTRCKDSLLDPVTQNFSSQNLLLRINVTITSLIKLRITLNQLTCTIHVNSVGMPPTHDFFVNSSFTHLRLKLHRCSNAACNCSTDWEVGEALAPPFSCKYVNNIVLSIEGISSGQ